LGTLKISGDVQLCATTVELPIHPLDLDDGRHHGILRVAHKGITNKVRKTEFSKAFCQNPEQMEYAVSGTNHAATDMAIRFQPTRLPADRSALVA
jgi:hypothetical protein